jgi:hypothetical protein
LKIQPPFSPDDFDPLYSWRLNVVEEGRKRLVVFMNDASRFGVVLEGIKANDWSKLPKLFEENLRAVMLAEQINPDLIDLYFENAGAVNYFRNNDKQMTAWINKACETACIAYSHYYGNVAISLCVSHDIVGTKAQKDCWQPNEQFYEKLSQFGLPLKKCRAFRLAIRLLTLGGCVKRELLVLDNITFEQLHKVIGNAYCWWDYKTQFNYMFYKEGKYGDSPDFMLYEERDPSSFPDNAKPMTGVMLRDYLPQYRTFQYWYDYTADWHHFLDVVDVVEGCTETLPVLLSGEGDAPPDKIGGVEGYAKLLDILKNGSYTERKDAERDAKYFSFEPFDFDKVNAKVKGSLKW